MGKTTEPKPVKRFVVILSPHDNWHLRAPGLLSEYFGPVQWSTSSYPWSYSPMYVREMGKGIKRSFHIFSGLISPDGLSDWKVFTNSLEDEINRNADNRLINLDPGYIDGSNVILASTKNYGNRIYLSNGIYADLTLYFDGKTFQPFKLTLPDYSTRSAIRFFNEVRQNYLSELERSDQTSAANNRKIFKLKNAS